MATLTFGRWLIGTLDAQRISRAEVARRLGVSTAAVSRWINDQRLPDWQTCVAIASALDLPENQVLAAAGHRVLRGDEEDRVNEDRAVAVFRRLSPEGQKAVMDFIEFQRGRERLAQEREGG